MLARVNVSAFAGWEPTTDTLARNKVSAWPALLDIEVTPRKQYGDMLCFHCRSLGFGCNKTSFGLKKTTTLNRSHLHQPKSTLLRVVNPNSEPLFTKFYFMYTDYDVPCKIIYRYNRICHQSQIKARRQWHHVTRMVIISMSKRNNNTYSTTIN